MSLRWRKNNKLVCGARSKEMKGDTYIGDRLHYQLAVIEKVVIPNKDEKKTGIWKWKTKEYTKVLKGDTDTDIIYKKWIIPFVKGQFEVVIGSKRKIKSVEVRIGNTEYCDRCKKLDCECFEK